MPNIFSPFIGDEQGGGGFDLFGGLGGLLQQFLGPNGNGGGVMPGGAPAGSAIAQAAGSLAVCGAPTTPFRAGSASGVRTQNFISCNPVTGAPVWFGKKGRPLLWSDDLAACKRVKRVASRASSAVGRSRRGRR